MCVTSCWKIFILVCPLFSHLLLLSSCSISSSFADAKRARDPSIFKGEKKIQISTHSHQLQPKKKGKSKGNAFGCQEMVAIYFVCFHKIVKQKQKIESESISIISLFSSVYLNIHYIVPSPPQTSGANLLMGFFFLGFICPDILRSLS